MRKVNLVIQEMGPSIRAPSILAAVKVSKHFNALLNVVND